MKKILGMILIIFFVLIFQSTALAAVPSTGWTGHGLYLLQDQNIHLNQVDVNITINADQTTSVEAKYELENKEDKMVNVYLGVPEHETQLEEFSSKVLPYRYGNKKVSGSSVNKQVAGEVKTDYKNWRTWYAPFQGGEKRTVEVTYKVDNKYISNGRYIISYQMDHIQSWKSKPKNVNIAAYFDNKEVKIYNFGNKFSIIPEVEEDFTLKWNFQNYEGNKSIDFDYYSVDYEIIKFLEASNSNRIKSILKEYGQKNYNEVIQLGKEYLQSTEAAQLQKEVYFLMADAYEQAGQPEESLIVYQLIEEEPGFYPEIQGKIQQIITYNKIKSYFEIQDYKSLYHLFLQVQENDEYSFIYKDWAEKQMNNIPKEEIDRIIEEERVPEGLEKIKKNLSDGIYNNYILIGGGIVLAIIATLNTIKKNKKDKKFLFRK